MQISPAKVMLAPMEGVLDATMRAILCKANQYDLCVTEFFRVVNSHIPKHQFFKHCPELRRNATSSNRTPVRVQLLGQDPQWMAENAATAIELGSHGIDINFGCPAKAVNKSLGGAILLKDPELIYQIVKKVKEASEHLSVKIRLGYEDDSLFLENVAAIASAGADELTVHARSKTDGYRPPAYWHKIASAVKIFPGDVIANGEIRNKESALHCVSSANTPHLMIGRGALAIPNLANVIKFNERPYSWQQVVALIHTYSQHSYSEKHEYYFSSRLKQWLKYLRMEYSQAETLFTNIKPLREKCSIMRLVDESKNYDATRPVMAKYFSNK